MIFLVTFETAEVAQIIAMSCNRSNIKVANSKNLNIKNWIIL